MRKRSRYRPRELRDTLSLMQPLAESARAEIEIRKLGALDLFTRGAGNRAEWTRLAECVNASEMACSMGYLPEPCRAICEAAQQALVGIAERSIRAGWGISGPELQALRDLLSIYSQALELLPAAKALGAHEAALRWAQDRQKGGNPCVT